MKNMHVLHYYEFFLKANLLQFFLLYLKESLYMYLLFKTTILSWENMKPLLILFNAKQI